MKTKKQFENFENYGDINYMEHGGVFIKQLNDEDYYIVSIKFLDDTNNYLLQNAIISINDTWIDKSAILSFMGMKEKEYNTNTRLYVLGVTEYYGFYHCNGSSEIVTGIKKAYSELLQLINN